MIATKQLYWTADTAALGDEVGLVAELQELPSQDVFFEVYENDEDGRHEFLGDLAAALDGPLAVARWRVAWADDVSDDSPWDRLPGGRPSLPEFHFRLRVAAEFSADSPILTVIQPNEAGGGVASPPFTAP